jgi:hypothetical protein
LQEELQQRDLQQWSCNMKIISTRVVAMGVAPTFVIENLQRSNQHLVSSYACGIHNKKKLDIYHIGIAISYFWNLELQQYRDIKWLWN